MGYLIAAGIVLLLLAAPLLTADSRDGGDWKPLPLPGSPDDGVPPRPFSRSPGVLAVKRASGAVARTAAAGLRRAVVSTASFRQHRRGGRGAGQAQDGHLRQGELRSSERPASSRDQWDIGRPLARMKIPSC